MGVCKKGRTHVPRADSQVRHSSQVAEGRRNGARQLVCVQVPERVPQWRYPPSTHARTHKHTHTDTHTDTQTHTHTQTRKQAHTHIHKHIHRHRQTHSHAHAKMNTHTHARMHARTHTVPQHSPAQDQMENSSTCTTHSITERELLRRWIVADTYIACSATRLPNDEGIEPAKRLVSKSLSNKKATVRHWPVSAPALA